MFFELHPNLQKKNFILDLPLSRVLFEDESHYPWILLVPRRNQIARMMDLEEEDQLQLLREINQAQKILWNLFPLAQLNVAAIGNKTPQLHIHIIGRTTNDPAWPGTVWDHPERLRYNPQHKDSLIQMIKSAFEET